MFGERWKCVLLSLSCDALQFAGYLQGFGGMRRFFLMIGQIYTAFEGGMFPWNVSTTYETTR